MHEIHSIIVTHCFLEKNKIKEAWQKESEGKEQRRDAGSYGCIGKTQRQSEQLSLC